MVALSNQSDRQSNQYGETRHRIYICVHIQNPASGKKGLRFAAEAL